MINKINKIAFGSAVAIIISVFSFNAFGQLSGNVNYDLRPGGNSSPTRQPVNSINKVQPAHRQKVIRQLSQQVAQYERVASEWEKYREQMRTYYFRCGQTNNPQACRDWAVKQHYTAIQKVRTANQYKQYYMNWLWHYENGQ